MPDRAAVRTPGADAWRCRWWRAHRGRCVPRTRRWSEAADCLPPRSGRAGLPIRTWWLGSPRRSTGVPGMPVGRGAGRWMRTGTAVIGPGRAAAGTSWVIAAASTTVRAALDLFGLAGDAHAGGDCSLVVALIEQQQYLAGDVVALNEVVLRARTGRGCLLPAREVTRYLLPAAVTAVPAAVGVRNRNRHWPMKKVLRLAPPFGFQRQAIQAGRRRRRAGRTSARRR